MVAGKFVFRYLQTVALSSFDSTRTECSMDGRAEYGHCSEGGQTPPRAGLNVNMNVL